VPAIIDIVTIEAVQEIQHNHIPSIGGETGPSPDWLSILLIIVIPK
jgi:hypothetical protein